MFESVRPLATTPGGDGALASLKSALPVTVTATMALGIPLEDWVVILTLIYLVVQIAYLVWKWSRELFSKKAAPDE